MNRVELNGPPGLPRRAVWPEPTRGGRGGQPSAFVVANEKKCFLPRVFKRTFLKSPNDGLTMKDQVLSSAVGALRAEALSFG